MQNFIFTFFTLLLTSYAFGQCQIIDKETKQPIPFVHVKVHNKAAGKITNYEGQFEIDSTFNGADSVVISVNGYEKKILSVLHLEKTSIVQLHASVQNIHEVDAVSKKIKFQRKKLGVTKKPNKRVVDYTIRGLNGQERATWIPNKYAIEGNLKSVSVFITDLGFPEAHFRIHVYDCSALETRPGKELTKSNIVTSATTGDEWVTVDLTNERITIPENGCFISIEWFDSPNSDDYIDTVRSQYSTLIDGVFRDSSHQYIREGNGMAMGSVLEEYGLTKNKIWYRNNQFSPWINWCTSTMDESRFSVPDTVQSPKGYTFTIQLTPELVLYRLPCINAEISFPKNKIKSIYDSPKKRKLNKLDKVKEDLFKYPQANVSELLSSIILACENNDIIYIFKYLCVYNDDGLEDILEEIEENMEERGEALSKDERNRIVDHIEEILNEIDRHSVIKVDAKNFFLKFRDTQYNLIIDNGKWKINPYSHKVML